MINLDMNLHLDINLHLTFLLTYIVDDTFLSNIHFKLCDALYWFLRYTILKYFHNFHIYIIFSFYVLSISHPISYMVVFFFYIYSLLRDYIFQIYYLSLLQNFEINAVLRITADKLFINYWFTSIYICYI